MSDTFVVCMGIVTVFVGLILIIITCKIVSFFCKILIKPETVKKPEIIRTDGEISPKKREEIIAAVTAACAEDMGTDVSALRVVSFKKL